MGVGGSWIQPQGPCSFMTVPRMGRGLQLQVEHSPRAGGLEWEQKRVPPFTHPPPFPPFQKNHFPPDSKTFAKLQELMLPRDPTYSQLSKAPDEELAVPS